jgi:hypothetical protein
MTEKLFESNGQKVGTLSPGPATPEGGLSQQDQKALNRLMAKMQIVRDCVGAVVDGYSTGLYLYGHGGVGKSHLIFEELNRRQACYKLFNSRMTGRGLYNALEKYPDDIHVLEDMEQITHDRGAQGVLRSALWGQPCQAGRSERPVTWSTYRQEHSFLFTGGIILIANRPLANLPELEALGTRLAVQHLQPDDAELRAMMRWLSTRGYDFEGRRMDSTECSEVCEFVLDESRSLHRSLDLRMLINSFRVYLQWQEGDAACHWIELVKARLRERPSANPGSPSPLSRAEQKQQDRQIAHEIAQSTQDRAERCSRWKNETGKSEQTLYRRLKELGWT